MEWLNYHHLFYFWAVARQGSIAAASAELGLAGPTISAQVRKLEDALGTKLLRRSGRQLVVTDAGRMVLPYAEEIFSLGRDIHDVIRGRATARPLRLAVGVIYELPKWVVYRLLQPALRLQEEVEITCRVNRPERLLADLAVHELDIVLTDTPAIPDLKVQCFSHLLGDSALAFYASAPGASRYRAGFPKTLSGAPLLLPSDHSAIRRSLDHWLQARGVQAKVVGKFDDFALMLMFAAGGEGVFAAPVVIEEHLARLGLERIGAMNSLRQNFYAISVERKIKHAAVAAICGAGRKNLFGRERRKPAPAK